MNETAAKNTVLLHADGYIEVKLQGDQTFETIERVARDCRGLVDQLTFAHKRVLGLINLSGERNFSTGSNKAAMEALSGFNYDRVAMFGGTTVTTEVGSLIVKALGKSENTRVFKTREEAVAWLLMRDPLHSSF